MSYVLTNAGIWLDRFNMQGSFNTVAIASEVEEKDVTVFGDTTRRMKGGLKTVSISGAGFGDDANPDAPDDALYSRVGSGSTALTLSQDGTAEGSTAFFVQPNILRYELNPQVGEIYPFSIGAVSKDGPLVRGRILHNALRSGVGTGGGSTVQEMGAVSASQKMYAALHVITQSGTAPTLDVIIQSDDANGFATPTNRITFPQQTGVGAVWATPVSGPVTDTWWRVTYTLGGTSPAFTFVVAFGIL